jgi:cell wall-associated NlpC family hydrolase
VGKTIGFINEAQAGDLAFFDNEEEQIVHVGILLNNTQIIHASGSVRIDSIDHQGIFNKTQQKYTHKLRLIKRVLS